VNVLFVIAEFRPKRAGAELQAERLALALAEEGIAVEILTYQMKGTPRSERIGNVQVTRLPAFGPERFWLQGLVPSVFQAVLARRNSFDVLHAHQALHPSFGAVAAAALLGKPSVVKVGNSGPRFDLDLLAHSTPRPLSRWMARRMARQARCFVSLNEDIRESLLGYGVPSERIRAIPNGVPVPAAQTETLRAEARVSLGLPNRGDVLISVGNLHPKKNHALLIDALGRLASAGTRPTLLILGDGPSKSSLEHQAAELRVSDQVRFLGSRDDVWSCLYAADVFVLTSLHEGISNALLEAMAIGLAVVVTDVPGNHTVVDDGQNGLLVGNGDAQQLAEGIKSLLAEKERARALGAAARRTILDEYDIRLVAARYRELYHSLKTP
jgi:glycosyltransferase involved in cell wall biosynthesis